ncbi:uncharacterized protein LOC127276947 [Leptopilina boulardi]|uniref:uncharacterized protein LOC127276947 n=1 Tax=Leptopilina boulardi TaxID=63433 RepID=UPI0021F54D25|nr:uncharacterized protein LOC127276947 [Leptopilina boulardi]
MILILLISIQFVNLSLLKIWKQGALIRMYQKISTLIYRCKIFKIEEQIPETRFHPQSTKVILQTKRTNGTVREMLSKKVGAFGEYVYLGIKQGLEPRIKKSNYTEDKINVIANIDGLPLFRKSNMELMPILMQIIHQDYFCTPFLVAIYGGKTKPDSVNEFLNDFVDETNDITTNGIEIDNKKYRFELKAMVCDTPASSG